MNLFENLQMLKESEQSVNNINDLIKLYNFKYKTFKMLLSRDLKSIIIDLDNVYRSDKSVSNVNVYFKRGNVINKLMSNDTLGLHATNVKFKSDWTTNDYDIVIYEFNNNILNNYVVFTYTSMRFSDNYSYTILMTKEDLNRFINEQHVIINKEQSIMSVKLDIYIDDFETEKEFKKFIKEKYNLDVEIIQEVSNTLTGIFTGTVDNIKEYLQDYELSEELLDDSFNDIKNAYLKAIQSDNEQDYIDWINEL